MRKTIIFGALVALLGLATAVQASDDQRYTDATQVAREAGADRQYDRHDDRNDRHQRSERTRDRHDEARDRGDNHDESQERRDRR
jgi:hypothetical protein